MAKVRVENVALPDPEFPICIMPFTGVNFTHSLHTHTFTELVVILGGQGTHILGETRSPVRSGDVYVIASGNAHAYPGNTDMTLYNVLFMPEVVRQYEADFRALPGYHALFVLEPNFQLQHGGRSRLHLSPDALVLVRDLIERMYRENKTHPPGYRLMMTTTLAQLITFLSRQYAHTENTPSRLLMQMGKVLSRMEKEYMQPLTLPSLAETASMSVRTLVRRFREGTGVSPIEYLIQLRVQHGAVLLRTTNDTIAEIACAVGIADSNYFSRQFKRIMGMTPRAYRERPAEAPPP